MGKIWTHYDNLQVARNASAEVIAAAYKSLSRKYHPDQNASSADSVRIMKIINTSYDVLSNPAKRRLHDDWIRQQESNPPGHPPRPPFGNPDYATPPGTSRAASHSERGSEGQQETYSGDHSGAGAWDRDTNYSKVFGKMLVGMIALITVMAILSALSPTADSGLPPYERETGAAASFSPDGATTTADAADATGHRPSDNQTADNTVNNDDEQIERSSTGGGAVTHAPDGSEWPSAAGYLPNHPRLHTSGYSAVTVDNSGNDSPVYVKLVSIETQRTRPVRHIYIPAGSSFTMRSVSSGKYDVRYMNISDGSLARTESFDLWQRETREGVEFENVQMTLYRVPHGNMQTYPLDPDEF